MRHYPQKYPKAGDLVMVQIRQIAEIGAYVRLLEYDNLEGMVSLAELSRRRLRSIQKLIRVGNKEVMLVLLVDPGKGIDLSRRRVPPDDVARCEDNFAKSKIVASIMQHIVKRTPGTINTETPTKEAEVSTENPKTKGKKGEVDEGIFSGAERERLEKLYEQIVWPLGAKYDHTYDAFGLALISPGVFDGLGIPQPVLDVLMSTIAHRLTPQVLKLRAHIEVTCVQASGIDTIKRALKAGEAVGTETVPVKAKLIVPPLYVLETDVKDETAGAATLRKAIQAIRVIIFNEGGDLNVIIKPKAVSKTEDIELAALMEKAAKENEEVSGDGAEGFSYSNSDEEALLSDSAESSREE